MASKKMFVDRFAKSAIRKAAAKAVVAAGITVTGKTARLHLMEIMVACKKYESDSVYGLHLLKADRKKLHKVKGQAAKIERARKIRKNLCTKYGYSGPTEAERVARANGLYDLRFAKA